MRTWKCSPDRSRARLFDRDRTAVILGNSMGGQSEDLSNLRVWFPEVTKRLKQSPQMAKLSDAERDALMRFGTALQVEPSKCHRRFNAG